MELSAFLKQSPLSQADFAALAGITQGYVARLAAGAKTPSDDLAVRIERVTQGKVPVDVWHPNRTWHRDAAGNPTSYTVRLVA